MRTLIVAAAVFLLASAVYADPVSDKFGNRVTQFHQYRAPYLTPDLDGDGIADAVYLVTIARGTSAMKIAADVKVFSNLFASKPLGNAAENMAIGIVFGKSGKKVLVTGFRGDEYEDFFDATWWNERSAPVRSVARGSHEFRICDARYQFLQNDYLSLRSGVDYEQFLAWNGKSFWPEPISPTSPPCGEKKF